MAQTPVIVEEEERGNEEKDDNIDRLIQENKEDNKSIKSFGKRTDTDSKSREGNNLKRVVPYDSPLKIAIQKLQYVGDYEMLWPLLLELDAEFNIEEGQIPYPLDLDNLERRMVSVMDIRENPSVRHWDAVPNREKFMTKEQMVLSFEVYLVAKQIEEELRHSI